MGILELPKTYGVSRLTVLFSVLLLLEGVSSNQQKLLCNSSGTRRGSKQTVEAWTSPLTQARMHTMPSTDMRAKPYLKHGVD